MNPPNEQQAIAALEARIAIARSRLRTLNFGPEPEEAVALAYAMMRTLTQDLGIEGADWHQFLREALEESITTITGR